MFRLEDSLQAIRLWLCAAAVAAAALVLVPRADAGVFEPETFTLDNGMQVVVVTNRRAPVVTQMVWYKVGAADEPPGRSGMAHFLEHLMFKGTTNMPKGAFSATVARLGGRENAFTGQDYTAYHQTIAKENLETVMALEADRMTNLELSDSDVETERQVVLEELRQRVENQPAAMLGEHTDAALYLNHPYRIPTIGWRHEVEALTRDDLLDFYRTWYRPDNAILVVVGDVDVDDVRPLAQKYYGAIHVTGKPPVHSNLTEPPQDASRRVSLSDERVRQATWSRAYLAPSYGTGDAAPADALSVAAGVLGAGPTSILYRRLVMEDKVAVEAGAAYNPSPRGPTSLTVYAIPRPGVAMADLETAVDAVLADTVAKGLSADDVERVKNNMLADAVYARDGLSDAANTLGVALAAGRTIEDVENWPDRMEAVTAQQANAALAAVLKPESSVTSLLLPAPAQEHASR